jgi:4-amino-4-deoxy-L-arabinose transferase-like glycosyltransferase
MPRPEKGPRPEPNPDPSHNPNSGSEPPTHHPIPRRDRARLFFFLGLLASAILYSAYNLYVLDPYIYANMGRGVRHGYKFGSLLIAWLIGILVFRKIAPSWLTHLWNTLYAASIAILLILALYDAMIHNLPSSFRQPVSTFHEALISPIPYVVIALLNFATRRPPTI